MRSSPTGPSRRLRSIQLVAMAALATAVACGSHHPSSAIPGAGLCATPRTGVDPYTGAAYPDKPGSSADEKTWLRGWIDAYYLWYREVPSPDPAAFSSPVAYFNVLKTSAVTVSGAPKDRFHFTYATDVWEALSQSGVEAGYGVIWSLVSNRPPRKVMAAFVLPGTPAAAAGIARGTEVVAVDGVAVLDSPDTATLNEGLFPTRLNAAHALSVIDLGGVTPHTVSVTSAAITQPPVPTVATLPTATGDVGYVLFNDHLAPAEAQLMAAFQRLKTAAVTDLVLDLRYNGGGYLAIASQVAYMAAGPTATAGKFFERTTFNDKAGSKDPVTGQTNNPTPYYTTALGFSITPGVPLPTLGLGRVFVLTGPGTCSASEAVMNGLRGAGLEVIQVGTTSCGKPFGFYPQDNCGTTYFAIQFQGFNQLGFGDYGDGFVPAGTGANGLPGCLVADDFGHALGDPAEGRLAAALAYRASPGACPAVPAATALQALPPPAPGGELVPPPWRTMRILGR